MGAGRRDGSIDMAVAVADVIIDGVIIVVLLNVEFVGPNRVICVPFAEVDRVVVGWLEGGCNVAAVIKSLDAVRVNIFSVDGFVFVVEAVEAVLSIICVL